MRGKHILKITGSVALSALIAATSALPVTVYAEEEDSTSAEKTETVYSVLHSDGSISDIVVSSWLHNDNGIKNLKEKLNLTDVKNVKTDEEPEDSNGVYTWNSDSNDVYYQGNSTEKLPVSMKITYQLDGQEMSESDLAGKSGHLVINIHLTNEHSETRTINDKQVILHPLFVAGGLMTLDTDHFSNVSCEQGKIVSDGSSQMLVFASVPGLKETLDSADLSKVSDELSVGDDVNIECDVTDYESAELMMGMTNEASTEDILGESDSLDELTDGITELMDADDQLVDGSKQLEEGTQQLITESQPLTSSSDSIRTLSTGAVTLNDGAYRLKAALAQYTGGVAQLNQGVNSLYAIPDGASQLADGTTQLVAGTSSLTAGLQSMKDQVNAGLNTEQMQGMMKQLSEANDALGALSDYVTRNLDALNTMAGKLSDASTTLTNLSTVSGKISDSATAILTATSASKDAIQTSIDTLPDGNDAVTTLQEQIRVIEEQEGTLNGIISALSSATNGTADDVRKLNDTLSTSITKLEIMKEDIATSQKILTQMSATLQSSQGALGGLASMKDTLNARFDQLIAGSKTIEAGVTQVNDGIQSLQTQSKAGIDTVKAATTTLANNNAALNDGMASLQDGTQTIANQSGSFNEMADGLDSLAVAFETLHDGAKELSDGQQKFKTDGIDKLKEELDLGTDEIEMLKDIVNAVNDLNKQYREYAGDNENMDVTTRYVFRTQTDDSNND